MFSLIIPNSLRIVLEDKKAGTIVCILLKHSSYRFLPQNKIDSPHFLLKLLKCLLVLKMTFCINLDNVIKLVLEHFTPLQLNMIQTSDAVQVFPFCLTKQKTNQGIFFMYFCQHFYNL